jgi:HK97 family phage major capsid protein
MKSFGDFIRCVFRKDNERLENIYGGITKAAMNETSGLAGGYTVPTEYSAELLQAAAEQSIIRPRAFIQPMTSQTMMVPQIDVETVQSAGVSPFFGGLQMVWGSEAQTKVETEPTFRDVELKAHELSGYCVASNPWLADAVGREAWLRKLITDAIAWYEDRAFLQENGVGKPLGILNASGALSVNRTTASQIKLADLNAMLAKFLPASYTRGAWVASVSTMAFLTALNDGTRSAYIPNDSAANLSDRSGTPLGTLFGLPVFVTEKVPVLGTKGDLILIDPTLYIIGDRGELAIDISPYASLSMWQKNQSVIRIVKRVDGQPAFSAAVTLADGSTQVSPFVILN